jgi:heterotetrameric sarcosine oxidase delta subunit
MITLPCPWCGPRNVTEFAYGGETVARPDAATVTPAEWRVYLYVRANQAGPVTETWLHRAGCRRYLVVERDTTSNEVLAVRRAGRAVKTPTGQHP